MASISVSTLLESASPIDLLILAVSSQSQSIKSRAVTNFSELAIQIKTYGHFMSVYLAKHSLILIILSLQSHKLDLIRAIFYIKCYLSSSIFASPSVFGEVTLFPYLFPVTWISSLFQLSTMFRFNCGCLINFINFS